LVQKRPDFVAAVRAAAVLADQGLLVTIGIRPHRPETGYGYIEVGEPIEAVPGAHAYRVARFTEKPDAATAERFLAGGLHLWNAGMFAWRVDRILAAIDRFLPDLYQSLQEIDSSLDTHRQSETLARVWPEVASISIDFGIMERASNVAVVAADIGWSDIGTWASLADVLPVDGDGNAVTGAHVGLDTRGTFVSGSGRRLVATIGIEDMVIVDTEDALLICPKDRAQDVKMLVDLLKQHRHDDYL
jgi:mannose-1-phosphate guanylyltransferase